MFITLDNPRRIINTESISSIVHDGSHITIYRLYGSRPIELRPKSGDSTDLEEIWKRLVGTLKAGAFTTIAHRNEILPTI